MGLMKIKRLNTDDAMDSQFDQAGDVGFSMDQGMSPAPHVTAMPVMVDTMDHGSDQPSMDHLWLLAADANSRGEMVTQDPMSNGTTHQFQSIFNAVDGTEHVVACGCPDCVAAANNDGHNAASNGDVQTADDPQSNPTTHLSTAQAGQQITRANSHWGSTLGQNTGPITFGFATSGPGYSVSGHNVSGFSAFTASEQAAARAALQMWADVAGITFSDQGNTNNATILFRNYNDPNDGAGAFAFRPTSNNQTAGSNQGDVFMNLAFNSTTINPGSYEWLTMIHEIGHALGLQHPGDYNAGPGVSITYANNAEYVEDSRQYTVMSYFSETNTGADFSVYNETPMLHDIAAIQRLYGANLNTRTGSTTYGFYSNAGTPYNITSGSQHVAFTVYDHGGYDTLNFSGYSQDATISLAPETFSSVGGDTNNVCIAQNTIIEYAYGGSGNDNIYGNDVNNYLSGGNGNDYLKGGGGDDTLVGGNGDDSMKGGGGNDYLYGGAGFNSASFIGNRADFSLSETANGLIVSGGASGQDTLHQVSRLVFDDVTITDDNYGDTSTAATIAAGGSAAGGMQFTGDHDWFRTTLTAGHNYVITERGAPSGGGTLYDSYVRLHNVAGNQLAYNDDGGTGYDSELAVHVNSTGTYYINAGSYGDYYTGTYTLELRDLGTTAYRFETPSLGLAAFGTNAGGWSSNDQVPRLVADVNGDGMADIVGFSSNGAIVSLATGNGHFGTPSLNLANFGSNNAAGGWTSEDSVPRLLGDVNGDGRADIVGFASGGVIVSLATGNGNFAAPINSTSTFGSNAAAGGWTNQHEATRLLGDVNGDGKADIVGFSSSGVLVSLATGNGNFAAATSELAAFGSGVAAGGWTDNDQVPRFLADVNGDYRADIVGFSSSGVLVSLATDNGHFAAPITALSGAFGYNNSAGGWTSENLSPRQLADINGDGRADIVGFGSGGVLFALGQANGTFAAQVSDLGSFGSNNGAGGWSSEDTYPRLLGDVTGDYRADIIGFGSSGVYVSASHDFIVV